MPCMRPAPIFAAAPLFACLHQIHHDEGAGVRTENGNAIKN